MLNWLKNLAGMTPESSDKFVYATHPRGLRDFTPEELIRKRKIVEDHFRQLYEPERIKANEEWNEQYQQIIRAV